MIGMLRGEVIEKTTGFFILDVRGVGYQVRAHLRMLSDLTVGDEPSVYIYEHIREDQHELFGFATRDELEVFEILISINGIGPKAGLAICGAATPAELRERVTKGDAGWFASLPGIGSKTAQKIILELKGQLVELEQESQDDIELVEALKGLGYKTAQAKEAAKSVSVETIDPSERVREALKYLSR
ncbi:Holliday junction branch migration protein RuvA [Candidatus Uhrbacteria bacterium]|nr:Holliday junction branch migration protein RuvA [Candidatus Uhrbacteria bacterium]